MIPNERRLADAVNRAVWVLVIVAVGVRVAFELLAPLTPLLLSLAMVMVIFRIVLGVRHRE